jgi:hypothetical protein
MEVTMGANHWQPWENLFLHEVAGQMPLSLIAEKLERTERAVYTQAARLDVKFPANPNLRKWTKAELFLFGRFTRGNRHGNRPLYPLRAQQAQLTCPIVRRKSHA